MKKSLFFLACSFGALGYQTQGNVLKLGQNDFNEALKQHPNMLVKFFAPWCGHCKTLAPTYVEAANALTEAGSSVKLAQVDCTVHRPLCQKYQVKGYPTVHLFTQGSQQPTKYTNARTKQAIVDWINEKVPNVPQIPQTKQQQIEQVQKPVYEKQGNLYKLTAADFETAKNSFDFLFVKFFAPWCGHCKNMAETWKTFANSITDQKVAIAEVDCTQHSTICQANGIRGYPTLKLFVRGNQVVDYKSGRTLQAFTQFLEQNKKNLIPGAIPEQKEQIIATEQL